MKIVIAVETHVIILFSIPLNISKHLKHKKKTKKTKNRKTSKIMVAENALGGLDAGMSSSIHAY